MGAGGAWGMFSKQLLWEINCGPKRWGSLWNWKMEPFMLQSHQYHWDTLLKSHLFVIFLLQKLRADYRSGKYRKANTHTNVFQFWATQEKYTVENCSEHDFIRYSPSNSCTQMPVLEPLLHGHSGPWGISSQEFLHRCLSLMQAAHTS